MIDKEMHSIHVDEVAGALKTHLRQGLTTQEAQARAAQHGYNELTERPRPGFLKMLLDQLNNFLVIILIVAAVISLLLGEIVDATAIMAIVVLNSILGVVQESKAEQALAALKKMAAPNAMVIRDGHQAMIPSRELVPGDIVLLEAGNYVPADMRLIESVNLKIEEASLTGESVPVNKNASVVLDKDLPIGDRKNSAFMSTLVTYGRGKGLITGTGMHTQIGMIAEMLQSYEEEPTPLQEKLDQLGKTLGTAALGVCALIFVIGIIRDTHPGMIFSDGILAYLQKEEKDIVELFMTAVSLAIAAVPEGLAAVVTICLALGMQRMVKRHALIRKLPAVETLGCATVICSDKTGTLTQNEMTVVRGWAGGKSFSVGGEGYNPSGQFFRNDEPFGPTTEPSASLLLHGALLCNDARLEQSGEESGERTWRMVGDPTEGAMVVAAAKAGLWCADMDKSLPRVAEIPFDSDRKRMTTIHKIVGEEGLLPVGFASSPLIAFVKGAPDILLQYCDAIVVDGQVATLTDAQRKDVLDANAAMARQALRVLGVAFRPMTTVPENPTPEIVEKNLTFVGLLGMIDPARPEVKTAVGIAKGAGLKSVMVTGDYKETAQAIAEEIKLLSPGGKVLTGAEVEQVPDDKFVEMVDHVDVYARVSPAHKVKIVEAFKARGHVVAMTGDGVNDAPALKRANIGIAMGITGTDVSKETADMVLTDDNFASIVSAIEEGRIIYSNIRKFVFYLLACNVGEILIIFLAMLANLPIPLAPIMLLWLNLVTDGAPAVALGLEKGDPDIMQRPPRPTKEPVINRDMLTGIVVVSLADTFAVLTAFTIGMARYPGHLEAAQTLAFTTLVFSELLRAYTSRSEYYSVFSIGLFSNKWMVLATASSAILMLGVLYIPFLQPFFGTVPLGLDDWLEVVPLFLVAPIAAELVKMYLRWNNTRRAAPAE
ncbi:MAG: cation-translocating P-type ATPase [Anaerolineales bacterium]|nr:cation-translocating P-type ATPase [Anaerolineales bacterium]